MPRRVSIEPKSVFGGRPKFGLPISRPAWVRSRRAQLVGSLVVCRIGVVSRMIVRVGGSRGRCTVPWSGWAGVLRR